MQSVAKMMQWPAAGGNCVLCCEGEVEDVAHFLQRCPRLQPCRDRLAREADCRLRNAGVPGVELLALLQAGGTSQLRALLGAPVGVVPTDVELYKQWAFARWTLDKLAKNFLLACWRLRGAYLGELHVERGVLKHTPSKLSVSDLLVKQQQQCTVGSTCIDSSKEFWTAWLPKVERFVTDGSSRRRAAFFVVSEGRQTGLFYKWSDCRRSVAGFEGARYRGFCTLAEAEDFMDCSNIS
jgi:hypothetical protein